MEHAASETNGLNKEGFNKEGFNKEGFNKEGFNEVGMNKDGVKPSGTEVLHMHRALNQLLGMYKEKTTKISELLKQTDDEAVSQIVELLNQRDEIINKYERTKQQIAAVSGCSIGKNAVELEQLETEKTRLLVLIQKVEEQNKKGLDQLLLGKRNQLKSIQQLKKGMHGYNAKNALVDGVFFDKRE